MTISTIQKVVDILKIRVIFKVLVRLMISRDLKQIFGRKADYIVAIWVASSNSCQV